MFTRQQTVGLELVRTDRYSAFMRLVYKFPQHALARKKKRIQTQSHIIKQVNNQTNNQFPILAKSSQLQ